MLAVLSRANTQTGPIERLESPHPHRRYRPSRPVSCQARHRVEAYMNRSVLIGSVRGRYAHHFVDQFRFRIDRHVAFVAIKPAAAALVPMAGFRIDC